MQIVLGRPGKLCTMLCIHNTAKSWYLATGDVSSMFWPFGNGTSKRSRTVKLGAKRTYASDMCSVDCWKA